MEQVKELLDNNPSAIDGKNFSEFKNYCRILGILGVTVEKVLELFTPTEHEGIYSYENTEGTWIYGYENTEGTLIELSDPSQFETNKVRKTKQYYFCVI